MKKTGVIEDQLISKTFTVVAATNEDYTTQLSDINTALPYYDRRITLEIVCDSLDSTVTLSQKQGLQDDISTMAPILDTETGASIADVLTNGNYIIESVTRSFFLGLSLDVGSATTGTVTVIIRA